jgi:hypothetical protein
VTDNGVELGRFPDAGEARRVARLLLAAGITPDVRRADDEHVIVVATDEAERAAQVLDLEVEGLARVVAPAPEEAGVDEAPEEPDDELDPLPWLVPAEEVEEADDDTAGLEVDADGFVAVALAGAGDEARAVAASLLEHGIGAELANAVDRGFANPIIDDLDTQVVLVLDIDAMRALDVLDAEPPKRLTPPTTAVEAASSDGAEGSVLAPMAEEATPPPKVRKPRDETPQEYFGGRLRITRRQLVTGITVYVAALILIPLLFFYLTRWILDPGGGDPTDTIPGFTTEPAD